MMIPLPPKPPVFEIISRPYEGTIPEFKEKQNSVSRLSNIIHEVNPDYLLFHPVINSIQNVWLLASYGGAWLSALHLVFLFEVAYEYIFVETIDIIGFSLILNPSSG